MPNRKKDYLENEIIEQFTTGEIGKRPYQYSCVKDRNGPRNKKKKPYIEIISEIILNDESKGIVPYINPKTEFDYSETGRDDTKDMAIVEKRLCRDWLRNGFSDNKIKSYLGIPCERELNIEPGTNAGVDLVSYNEKTKELFLIEVKGRIAKGKYTTQETLLRAVLEIKTYYESLKDEHVFKKILKTCRDVNKTGMSNATYLRMAILIPKGCNAAKQLNKERYPYTNRLIERWGIKVFCFDENA